MIIRNLEANVVYKRQLTNQDVIDALKPTKEQQTILIIIGVYIVAIVLLWNIAYLKLILYPFKLITVALHEFSHAFAGLLTGAKVLSITVDPDEGGLTKMRGGKWCCTMPAGYLGSSFIGAVMVMSGFNLLASKIVSALIVGCLLATLFWARNWLTRVITVFFMGIIVGLFFLFDGVGLQYFSLFMGVMSCLYSLWDIVEDLVVRKVNESDATKFAKATGCPSQLCGFLWFLISIIFLAGGVLLGLVLFK